jgi:hypothetical protein
MPIGPLSRTISIRTGRAPERAPHCAQVSTMRCGSLEVMVAVVLAMAGDELGVEVRV